MVELLHSDEEAEALEVVSAFLARVVEISVASLVQTDEHSYLLHFRVGFVEAAVA